MSAEIIVGPDGKSRCRWCDAAPEFLAYHDTEWGFPVSDDHRLFEKLSLESFQSGLSWRTIFGELRDRYQGTLPSILLYGFYDQGFHFTLNYR